VTILFCLTMLSLLAASLSCSFFGGVYGVIIDSPKSYPSGWVAVAPTPLETPIELVLAVKQQNVDGFLSHLDSISYPDSDSYGNWLTRSEMNEMIAPSKKSLNIINEWLLSSNEISLNQISSVTPNSDFIKIKTTIGVASSLLGCKYYDYIHNNDKYNIKVPRMDINCDYHVPSKVASHLDFISPTKRFPLMSKLRLNDNNIEATSTVTPSVLKSLYKVGDAVGEAKGNSEGIASFVRQYYSQSSLEKFWSDYDIKTDNVTKTDANDGDGDGLEALLDTQYITAMGELIPLQVWYNEGTFSNAMLNWITSVETSENAPLLFSVSYGEPETNWGVSAVERLNVEFAKVTSLGISVFFASGDSGAGGGCTYDEAFEPEFPASSPYVTTVGGVYGGNADDTPIGEQVWVDGGGGFSSIASTQSWQTDQVSSYLSNANRLPSSDQYNSTGRGYPDISAQSVDFEIVRGTTKEGVSGTSCASPTAAGVFALLNDLRLQNDMSPLGYLNPFIYETGAKDDTAFNDVTQGYNKGCSNLQEGFTAITGWDPASGWGSPNYEVLKTYVLESGKKTKKYAKKVNWNKNQKTQM